MKIRLFVVTAEGLSLTITLLNFITSVLGRALYERANTVKNPDSDIKFIEDANKNFTTTSIIGVTLLSVLSFLFGRESTPTKSTIAIWTHFGLFLFAFTMLCLQITKALHVYSRVDTWAVPRKIDEKERSPSESERQKAKNIQIVLKVFLGLASAVVATYVSAVISSSTKRAAVAPSL